MIPSHLSDGSTVSTRDADLETIRHFLEMKIVQMKLQDLGVDQSKVNQKIAELSDDQLHNVAKKIDLVIGAGASSAAEDELMHEGAETLRFMRMVVLYAIIGGIVLTLLTLILI
jgi:hypothetical protein